MHFDSNTDSKKKKKLEVTKGDGKYWLRPNSAIAYRY